LSQSTHFYQRCAEEEAQETGEELETGALGTTEGTRMPVPRKEDEDAAKPQAWMTERLRLTLIGLAMELNLGLVVMDLPVPWVYPRGG